MVIDIVLVYAQGRGGLEDVITTVSNKLQERGHKVRVFQAYEPEYICWKDTIPEIYFYGLNKNINEDDIYSLSYGYKKLIDIIGIPDIIIATHAPVLSLICNLSIKHLTYNKPTIISWIHGKPEYYGMCELLKYSYAHLAISNDIGDRINNYIEDKSNIYYVGNPVNLENLKLIKQDNENLNLLYIGRLNNKDKRLDILFNALKLLDKSWHLKIIGSGVDEKNLKLLATDLDIYDNIEWCGWMDKPWESVNSATALVLTSDEEGFGLVLVEALGRGIPVISSDCEGPKDIIKEFENGWMFNKGDYHCLYNILFSIQHKKLSLPKGIECVKSVRKFNVECFIDNFESILLKYFKTDEKILSEICSLLESNEIEQVIEYILCYNNRLKDNSEFLNIKGIVEIRIGEYELAIKDLMKAIYISNKDDINIYYNLAYAYEKNNDINNALKMYKLMLNLVDNNEKREIMNIIDEIEYV